MTVISLVFNVADNFYGILLINLLIALNPVPVHTAFMAVCMYVHNGGAARANALEQSCLAVQAYIHTHKES